MTFTWSIEDIARELRYELTQARKIVYLPDFPKAIRVFDRSHPRWEAEEVKEWFRSRKAAA